jgi:hypothetical protein
VRTSGIQFILGKAFLLAASAKKPSRNKVREEERELEDLPPVLEENCAALF